MLEVKKIHTCYGLSHILFDVSLKVEKGETVCLMGRNGAGKSAAMKSVMGIAPPESGSILFKGKEIAGEKPHKIARMGIGYVPGDRRVFADLTVGENLEISERAGAGGKEWDKAAALDFFPALKAIDSRKASFLSGGEQQMLAIGRALVTNPDFLLLDEPAEGLAPIVVETLIQRIGLLKKRGMTILLAEQNLKAALALSDRGYVMENGRVRAAGPIEELEKDPEIRKKYLGV
ncbi:leucine/isoleucine/valine transporter subunit; ATP-binding component of ABC superfamily [Candidatus Desulfarcum epimagneticum]|uniref:Leucine/isoleucine/valine transporter subunit ATP-binding component of ABC superfamily n=1 Tax=uncultured Desulfobacteraceae bacterium TaxID=218296 RepID=A0A484HD75_9BACT|nr:leucine/isoleucine/valine transporter subunit; ATP-binding component of ABC superfamily [uncultured Desulfobacteraceae bacterium]